MQYLGGKAHLAKKFAPILVEALEQRGGRMYEPFVGGFNVVPALGGAVKWVHCSDIHPGLITLYCALQDGWRPPTQLSKEEYGALRATNDQDDPLTAFAAFGCSFGGKEWGGYAVGEAGRNYAQGSGNTLRQSFHSLPNCIFLTHDYADTNPQDCVIYCDPPYVGTTGYKTGDFDHQLFHRWCEDMSRDNDVFISEFTAPGHWKVVYKIDRKVSVRKDSKYATRTDRLYRCVSGCEVLQ